MLKPPWSVLGAGLVFLVATPGVAQELSVAPSSSESPILTTITGTELDQVIHPVTTQVIPSQSTSQPQNQEPFSFSSLPIPAPTPVIESATFGFQETEVIIAHGDGEGNTFDWSSGRPDGHAPIGVMGDHVHGAGEWMVAYRYMFMGMGGNRDGTDDLTTAEVLNDFMVTPVDMTMQMHMFGAMYAPTDDLTLMAMLPFVFKEMDHLTRSGVEFTTNSGGLGDIKLSGLYNILRENRQRVHLNLGFSLPTGSIDERDDTPAGDDQIWPYPMQIGSGTFDLLPGITYLTSVRVKLKELKPSLAG